MRANNHVCPLCFVGLDHKAQFHWFCPKCGAKDTIDLRGKVCNQRHCQGARKSFYQGPLLAHSGCSRKNPLFFSDKTRAEIRESGELAWFDADIERPRIVGHPMLSPICNAQQAFPGVQEMWFPQQMLNDTRNGRATRVLLCGSTNVGKSVLASVVVSEPAFLDAENYGYATPSSDEQQPFKYYASVLQTIQNLKEHQPITVFPTDRATLAIIRAGFYATFPGGDPPGCLVLYDLAGELFWNAGAHRVVEQYDAADAVFTVIDITHLSAFSRCANTLPSAPEIAAGLAAADRSLGTRKTIRTIPVVTKVDLLTFDDEVIGNADLSDGQKRGLRKLNGIIAEKREGATTRSELENLAWDYLVVLKDILDPKNGLEKQIRLKLDDIAAAFLSELQDFRQIRPLLNENLS